MKERLGQDIRLPAAVAAAGTTFLPRPRHPHQSLQLIQPPHNILLHQNLLKLPSRLILDPAYNLFPDHLQDMFGVFGRGGEAGGEVGVGAGVDCVVEGGGEDVVEGCGAGAGGEGCGGLRGGGGGAGVGGVRGHWVWGGGL